MLPDEAIEEFREIYKKEYGEELSKEDARERAERLFGLVKAVYSPKQQRVEEKMNNDEKHIQE